MQKYFFLLLVSLVFFLSCGKSKSNIPRANTLHPLRHEFKLPLSIPAGEQLVYEIKITRFPIFATAGEITFEYLGAAAQPHIEKLDYTAPAEMPLLHFRATALSRGLLIKLFGISINDRFETLVEPERYQTQAIIREVDENKRHTLQTGLFDNEKKTAIYRLLDLNKPEGPATQLSLKLDENMLDLLAAFYFIRLQSLMEDTTLKFPLIYDARTVDFELNVLGREEIATDLGKFKTIRVEPKLFGPRRLINKEGEIYFWLTDDDQHVPVKVTAKASGATINAELVKKNILSLK